MQRAIERFLAYLEVEKRSSPNTTAAYRNDLGQFRGFVGRALPALSEEDGSWQSISPDTIQRFLVHLQDEGYAASTVARKIAALKSFFAYLVQTGLIRRDPTRHFKPPKVKKSLPYSMGPDEVNRLLAAPSTSSSPKSLRDKALLETLYATGMRVSELVQLDVANVDLAAGAITCGTDSSRRTVPLHPPAVEALQRYVNEGRAFLNADEGEAALFLNHRGKRLTRQGLWLIIREYVRSLNISDQVTPHTLRHSFATHMLNAGANLRDVQERLGHASASTTQIYRKVTATRESEIIVDGLRSNGSAPARNNGRTGGATDAAHSEASAPSTEEEQG